MEGQILWPYLYTVYKRCTGKKIFILQMPISNIVQYLSKMSNTDRHHGQRHRQRVNYMNTNSCWTNRFARSNFIKICFITPFRHSNRLRAVHSWWGYLLWNKTIYYSRFLILNVRLSIKVYHLHKHHNFVWESAIHGSSYDNIIVVDL